jgi:drug/metabolite transporter (DMT)-like permease
VALPFTLLSWGQQFVPSAFAGVVIGSVPLLVLPLVAIFSPEEGIGPRRVVGLLMGFAGLLVLFGPAAFPGLSAAEAPPMLLAGTTAFVAAAACYAVGSVLTRRAPSMPPVSFAAGTLVIAAIVLMPIALVVEGWPREWPRTPTIALLYAALGPTALAAVIRVRVITTAGSLFMSITSYMVPIWSVIFGITLLGEDLPPQLFTALALTLAGIGIAQSRAIAASLRRRPRGP